MKLTHRNLTHSLLVLVLVACGGADTQREFELSVIGALGPESAALTTKQVEMEKIMLEAQAEAFTPLNDKKLTPEQFKAAVIAQDSAANHIREIGDFNGDGKADSLWQAVAGNTNISFMNTTQVASCGNLATQTDTIMGKGDFDGDGKDDIVWRNMSTGAVRISLMNGGTVTKWLYVGQSPIALNTKLEGIGDFDGNGRADMLWRNQTTGRSVMSYHNADGSVASWPLVSNYINPSSTTALKVGDLNGDGKDDIVWRNMSTGNVVISLMNGNTPTWRGITQSPIALNVKLEAIGDFDGNGRADMLWRNTVTGRSLMSYHNADGSVANWPIVSNYINPVTTSAVGVGDFDADGKADILWRNLTTGNSVISLMNGNTPNWQGISFSLCPQDVTRSLPPEPGTSATSTLSGVDVNANGIRDEVERTLSRNIPDDSAFASNKAVASLYQQVLSGRVIANRADALAFHRELHCLRKAQTEAQRYGTESQEISKLVFDTEQRRALIRLANSKLEGGISGEEIGPCPSASQALNAKSTASRNSGDGYDWASDDPVLIMFVNGITNEGIDSSASSSALMNTVGGNALYGHTYFYNPTEGFVIDNSELVAQAYLSLAARDHFGYIFEQLKSDTDAKLTYMKQLGAYYETVIAGGSEYTYGLAVKGLAVKIKNHLTSNPQQKIVLVPHSQGNFMVEAALSYLYKIGFSNAASGLSQNDLLHNISVAGFASVAATSLNNNYLSGTDDLAVFAALKASTSAVGLTYSPLSPTANTVADLLYFRDASHHNFIKSYLSDRVTDTFTSKRMNVRAKEIVVWSVDKVLATPFSKLTDTGITASQCYQAGSDTLVACSSAGALALNNQQDGMVGRDVTTPNSADGKLGFSYSTVGSYPITDCVKDNITGLTWEGKPTSGTRGSPALNPNGVYTNYANVGSAATYTTAQINATTNAQGYANAVNAAGHCGFNDWRLPTAKELQSIVNYSAYFEPTIDSAWFPNTAENAYWSSSSLVGNADSAWFSYFHNGNMGSNGRYVSYYVRLVR